MNTRKRKIIDALCSIGLLIILLAVWYVIVVAGNIPPYKLPSPVNVLEALATISAICCCPACCRRSR